MVIAVCALYGLVIGSFLNVVIYRVPAGRSVVRPSSRCPSCEVPIATRDNLPVISWLLLRGEARCCKTKISVRYPLVEAGTAIFFGVVAAWAGLAWHLPGYLYFAAISVALAMIDIDTFRLPFWIVAPSYPVAAVLLGGASALERDAGSAVRMVVGGAALWTFYRVLHQIKPNGMAYGDVRLAGLVGMYLAWRGWGELVTGGFFGFFTGGIGGMVLIAARRGGLKTQIPYGPYLLLGAWIALFFGHAIADWYLRLSGL